MVRVGYMLGPGRLLGVLGTLFEGKLKDTNEAEIPVSIIKQRGNGQL